MTRNLKALGLALVVVFALSAVVASAASAQGKLTSDGAVTLIGKQPVVEPTKNNALTAFGSGKTICPNTIYTGHKTLTHAETTAGKTHALIPSGSTQATITPHYGTGCTAIGLPSTVDMNGCDYVFDLQGTTGSAHEYFVDSTVVCPPEKHITLTVWTSVANHNAAGHPFCHFTVTEQAAAYGGLSATDLTNGKVQIKGVIGGIVVDKAATTGSILCPTQTDSSASLDVDITVEGKNAGGGATNISLSD